MLINILIFILSIIPSVLIVFFLRKRRREDPLYVKSCRSALIRGVVSVLPILGVSGILYVVYVVLGVTVLKDIPILFLKAFYTFIVLAFAEELVKFLVFQGVLKKKLTAYSWADITAIMVIVGTAFGLIEDLIYAIGASVPVMLLRGITMGHVGYGFVMGWFYGKMLYTGKKRYGVISFMLPFLLHGLYDFSLTPELIELNEGLMAIALLLALLDIVLLILMVRFFVKEKKKERYQIPLTAAMPAADEKPLAEAGATEKDA